MTLYLDAVLQARQEFVSKYGLQPNRLFCGATVWGHLLQESNGDSRVRIEGNPLNVTWNGMQVILVSTGGLDRGLYVCLA